MFRGLVWFSAVDDCWHVSWCEALGAAEQRRETFRCLQCRLKSFDRHEGVLQGSKPDTSQQSTSVFDHMLLYCECIVNQCFDIWHIWLLTCWNFSRLGHYLLVDTWLRWLRWLSWSDVYSCCILLRASCGTCSLQTELAGAEKNAELCEVLRDEMSTLKPKIQSSMVRYTAKCRCNGRENMGKNCIKQPNFTFCMNFPTNHLLLDWWMHYCTSQSSLPAFKQNTLTTGGDTTRQVAGDGLLILPVASSGYNRNLRCGRIRARQNHGSLRVAESPVLFLIHSVHSVWCERQRWTSCKLATWAWRQMWMPMGGWSDPQVTPKHLMHTFDAQLGNLFAFLQAEADAERSKNQIAEQTLQEQIMMHVRIIQTLLSHAFASNVIFDHPLWSIATQPGARYPCGRPDQGAFARLLCALRFCALRNDFVLLSSHVQNLSPVKSLDLWDCEDIQKYRSEHRALKDQVFASITLDTLEG